MKKIILLLLLLPLIGLAQQNNTTNTNFTNGLASSKFFNIPRGTVPPTTGILAGSLFFHTVDGLQYYDGSVWKTVAATGLGVTSFNGRTGAVTPQSGDYSSFYVPLARTLSTGYGLTGGGDLSANRTLVADTTSANGLVSKSRLATNLGGYVPYINATGDVNLGTHSLKAESITLDSVPATIPTSQGSMYFSDAYQTLAVVLNGTVQRVGEDVFFQVKNQTGVTIPKGTAVRYDGVVGGSGRIKVVPFLADGSHPSIYFVGVTSEDIANGADGKAYFFGSIRGINTNAYPVGTILYASTTVAGGFQSTAPVAPNNIISVAAVTNQGTSNGEIVVRPLIGSNINNDEGVKITNPIAGDLLQYKASGLWENEPLDSTGLVTIATNQTITGAKSFNTDITTRNGSGLIFYNNGNTSSTSLYANGGLDNEFFTILLPAANGTVALTSNLSSYVPTYRTISAGTGLLGGGDLSTNRTISADTTVLRTTANSLTLAQTQSALNLKENLANKATDFSTVNNTLYPTVQAVKTYADGLVVGLLNDRGSYDPTATSAYPTTGGSGAGGAIKKGDIWYISANGTIGGITVLNGYSVRALADSPAQVAANWNILQVGLGYVPENVANKATDLTSPDNTKYPTTLAVSTALSTKQPTLSGTGLVKSTAGTISYITDNSTNWNTAYTYSQIGHLPLSGGTLTGPLNGTTSTMSGKISWGTGSYSAGVSSLWNQSDNGTVLLPKSGTINDFTHLTAAGGILWQNPTGTNNAVFEGSIGAKNTIYSNSGITEASGFQLNSITMGYSTTGTYGWITAGGAAARTALALNANGGNVGIGTTSPSYKLQVDGSVALGGGTSGVTRGDLYIDNTSLSAGVYVGRQSTTGSDNTKFYVQSRTGNNVFYVDGGNQWVGIGTTTDAGYKLDVNGTGRFSGSITSTIGNNSVIFNSASATTGYQNMNIQNTSGRMYWGVEGSAAGSLLTGGTTYAGVITTGSTQNLEFGTNQTLRFKLDGSTGAATFSSTVASTQYNINNVGGKFSGEGGATNYLGIYKDDGSPIFRVVSNGTGAATFSNLAGSGDRFVVANSSGTLITATIGSGLSYSGGVLSATGGATGTVTGTGTAGFIPKWNSASDIGNSIMSESGSAISLSGSMLATSSLGSNNAVYVEKPGSNSVGSGPYFQLGSAVNNRYWLNQLSAGFNMDFWYYNGSTWSNYITFGNTGTIAATSFTGAGTGLTGTASGLSIGGNAATWGGQSYTASQVITPDLMLMHETGGTWKYSDVSGVRNFLGLGSAAYTASSAYYASGSTVANSTGWNGYGFSFSNGAVSSYIMSWNGSSFALSGQTELRSFLGLGSNAYTSTTYAPLNSPGFTGTPTAPTPTAGDNSTKIATTEFIANATGRVLLRSTTTFSGSGLGSSQDYNTGIQSGSILLVIPGSSDAAGAGYYVAKNPGCGGLCDEWHIIFPNGAPIGTSNITFYYVVLQ